MGLPYTMALWFQLLLLMCGSGIHGVKDLREKQGDAQLVRKVEDKYSLVSNIGHPAAEESSSQVEVEDKYSRIAAWKPFVGKTPQSSSQLAKELEDKYSRIAAWKPFVDKTPQSSSQLAKELEDTYSALSG
ncbi:uncharacterized protein LOC105784249 isoform X2 [Gossypium raimondii]|uniref:Uncharacterized protein n=1 Tax=Gossypium raimondii TaxID=29730 RepID=A0A0D2VB16_GOSRA|nr:uncharacterized protein LOC105784249 isoform X2 [Gossypium raimondii]KJB79514.1 hypothetical protein B456_013G053100 [Gossypium raimondii]